MAAERHALGLLPRAPAAGAGRILCYHSVGQPELGVNDVPVHHFRRHLEIARELGYRFIPARQIALGQGTSRDLAITFDDAWASVKTTAAPILEKLGVPWSVFVVTGWSDHDNEWLKERVLGWDDLSALARSGVDLGSHSRTHPDFGKLDEARAIDEIAGSHRIFTDRLGFAPRSFAIPFGQSGNWTPFCGEAARDAGYEVVYAQAVETRPADTIARNFVTRFDGDRLFRALLAGAYDRWEEWS